MSTDSGNCPMCGAAIEPRDTRCPACGEVLLTVAEDEAAGDDLGRVELETFVGKRADYYLGRWARILKGTGTGGFNWAAFFLAGFWLPYRKMYRNTAIFYGLVLSETALEEIVKHVGGFGLTGDFQTIVTLIIGAICGAYGNRWYLSFAQQQIAKLKAEEHPRTEFLEKLSKRGGTSLVSGLGIFFGMMIILFTLLTILAVIQGIGMD
ncbi:MAG: DUF2628 domain-containing protein, partial [Planctomycetes bacterium]|nr:DUF2628 domain-containing protein [Planctomycetota bacterium]